MPGFFYYYFETYPTTSPVARPHSVEQHDNKTNDESERIIKEAEAAQSRIWTTTKTFIEAIRCREPRFEPSTYRIRVKSLTATPPRSVRWLQR
jgi:hypothetical protein